MYSSFKKRNIMWNTCHVAIQESRLIAVFCEIGESVKILSWEIFDCVHQGIGRCTQWRRLVYTCVNNEVNIDIVTERGASNNLCHANNGVRKLKCSVDGTSGVVRFLAPGTRNHNGLTQNRSLILNKSLIEFLLICLIILKSVEPIKPTFQQKCCYLLY